MTIVIHGMIFVQVLSLRTNPIVTDHFQIRKVSFSRYFTDLFYWSVSFWLLQFLESLLSLFLVFLKGSEFSVAIFHELSNVDNFIGCYHIFLSQFIVFVCFEYCVKFEFLNVLVQSLSCFLKLDHPSVEFSHVFDPNLFQLMILSTLLTSVISGLVGSRDRMLRQFLHDSLSTLHGHDIL